MTEPRMRMRQKGQQFDTRDLEAYLIAFGDDRNPLPETRSSHSARSSPSTMSRLARTRLKRKKARRESARTNVPETSARRSAPRKRQKAPRTEQRSITAGMDTANGVRTASYTPT
ncbi:transcriptionfactorTFIIDcomplexsubunitTaf13 [Macrophomina phaseolina MS6]|uniref:TranscriptionfactorTFIIDcomplexsubunitTaf13 n=1 Tax=Macrophomina phaseolina (strain MS6) TaxID=1126212 RepID=K2SGP6_MACPH|nr:transcriptionfactorTFIIDcomplexsubunitTaf13 [Macrophomina phaseolina MS6]